MPEAESTNFKKYTSKNPLKRLALKNFYRAVMSMPIKAEMALDAGCGEGFSASRLLKAFPDIRIAGVDISPTALKYSQKHMPQMSVALANITCLPFSPEQFDLVMSLEVLEHIPQPEQAVQMYKLLSRRYLLLSVPNEPIFRMLRMIEGNDLLRGGDHPEHVNHWNLVSFPRFLEEQGLKVIERKVPFPFSWVICLCERV